MACFSLHPVVQAGKSVTAAGTPHILKHICLNQLVSFGQRVGPKASRLSHTLALHSGNASISRTSGSTRNSILFPLSSINSIASNASPGREKGIPSAAAQTCAVRHPKHTHRSAADAYKNSLTEANRSSLTVWICGVLG